MVDKSPGQVIVRDGAQQIACIQFVGGHMVIGRTDAAEIQLPAATVSRKHAELFSDPFGRWWVRDLGSRNGTLVNGQKVDEQLIETGDVIRIEHFDIEVQLAGPLKQRPRVQMSGTSLTITDMDASSVTRLDDMGTPKIDREHIKRLTAFASDLLTTEADALRLQKLCQLMVGQDIHGNSALAHPSGCHSQRWRQSNFNRRMSHGKRADAPSNRQYLKEILSRQKKYNPD
jgi:predicted component of type VI protein secretion system